MGLSRYEQETVIRASADDKEWDVWTCDPRVMRLLKKRGYEVKLDHQGKGSVSCRIPLGMITIRSANQAPRRKMTTEERANAGNRLRSLRAASGKTKPEEKQAQTAKAAIGGS